jgi:hypothetical protein
MLCVKKVLADSDVDEEMIEVKGKEKRTQEDKK